MQTSLDRRIGGRARTGPPILLLALAASLAVGCGGDSGGGVTIATSSLSKAQFVRKANAFCFRRQSDNLNRIGNYIADHPSEGESPAELYAAAIKAVVVPQFETENAYMARLGAPAGDEEPIEEMLIARQEGIESIAEAKTVANRFDFTKHFIAANKLIRGYGLDACAAS